MKIKIGKEKKARIQEGMIGLFFEDINYAADGGLYAEMLENRSFAFYECYGDKGDYYAKPDPGYGWRPAQENGGAPIRREQGRGCAASAAVLIPRRILIICVFRRKNPERASGIRPMTVFF